MADSSLKQVNSTHAMKAVCNKIILWMRKLIDFGI